MEEFAWNLTKFALGNDRNWERDSVRPKLYRFCVCFRSFCSDFLSLCITCPREYDAITLNSSSSSKHAHFTIMCIGHFSAHFLLQLFDVALLGWLWNCCKTTTSADRLDRCVESHWIMGVCEKIRPKIPWHQWDSVGKWGAVICGRFAKI